MTPEEQQQLTENLDAMCRELRRKGYSPQDLHVIFNGFAHRTNADQYDPYEYDRIALSLRVRETVEEWRDDQDGDVPDLQIGRALRDLAQVYRDNGYRELYQSDGESDD